MKLSDLDLRSVGNTIQLAGAIWQGEGKVFLCVLPESNLGNDEIVPLEMNVDEWTKFLRQTDILETEVLAKLENNKIGKAVIRKSQRQVAMNVSWVVYRRDGFKCRYCGADEVPLTVDHVVLWEVGGPSIPTNLVACCRKCNATRGNLDYKAWLETAYYKKASRGLSPEVRDLNDELTDTLDEIPRMVHKPSGR